MSGIYIPGMEVPKSCAKCQMFGEYGCPFIGAVGYALTEGRRSEDCPLIPVPDHGRLIDKDALERDISENVVFSGRERNAELIGANKIINRLHRAPTIIPADPDKEVE